jgi:hypothetical protein
MCMFFSFKKIFQKSFFLGIFFAVLFFSFFIPSFSFSFTGGSAIEILIEGNPQDGDMISFDEKRNAYFPASKENEKGLFGVVVFNPTILLKKEGQDNVEEEGSGRILPILRNGEVMVNVFVEEGTIKAGDIIGPSEVEGFGKSIDKTKSHYVLGTALEDIIPLGRDQAGVVYGKVRTALHIGQYMPGVGIISGEKEKMNALENGGFDENRNNAIFDILQLFRYIIGSLVALVAVILAVRSLGHLFSQGIISIGRNPLAKTHINSILFWNSFLILLLSAVGFFIGMAIIFFA